MKPIAFNYQDYEKALERIRKLEARCRELLEENTNLKILRRINTDSQLIVVDSREKPKAITRILDYFDRKGIEHVTSKMLFGDYMDYNRPWLVIDRKQNIAELAKNCTIEHERFRNELELAKRTAAKLVILVEEDKYKDREEWVPVRNITDLLRWSSPHTQVRGEQVYRVLASWGAKYPIEVVFCDKRSTGRMITKILYEGEIEALEGQTNGN